LETGVGITTLDGDLLLQTDYGIVPLKNILIGMYVQTKNGMRQVAKRISRKKLGARYYIDVSNTRVRFSLDQIFYKNGKPVNGYELRKGDLVDTIKGPRIITKRNVVFDYKLYHNLFLDTVRSNFCLLNGLIVSL
jgi:hypothetical protein